MPIKKKEKVLKHYRERKAMISLRNKTEQHGTAINNLLSRNERLSDDLLREIRKEALVIVMICDDAINWDTEVEV